MVDLIKRIPKPDNKIFELIRKSIKNTGKLRKAYEETGAEEIQKQNNRLTSRIDNLYTDKLDGKITEDYWKEKHNQWYEEKDELYEKLQRINKAARTFDEGANLLENFCKVLPDEYLKASPKEKQQILKIIGSNFYYKDKKVSVELTSVFDLLINNQFFNNGGNDEARLGFAPRSQSFAFKPYGLVGSICSLSGLTH